MSPSHHQCRRHHHRPTPASCPAKERAVELADNGKGKREKKERGGSSVGVSDDDDAPGFAVG